MIFNCQPLKYIYKYRFSMVLLTGTFNRWHPASNTPHPNPLPRPWGEGRVRGTHATILMLQITTKR
jgi:hypothetical protein